MKVNLRVVVRPGAGRSRVKGRRMDGAWKLEVGAPPEGGKANDAVEELLAEVLELRRGRVEVTRGRTSRTKRVAIEGLTEDEVQRRIERALAGPAGGSHGE